MFTINIYLKFALIALSLGLAVLFMVLEGFGAGYYVPFLIIGLILLASYIFLGTVSSAAQMVQKMDFDGAEKRLGLILKPEFLYVTNKAFYYILKGSIFANRKDNDAAEDLFEKALALKLPSDNEKAMVLLQLANINGSKNKWTAAKKYFRDADKLKVTEPQIKEQLDMFRKAINNSGQMKAGGMGGKRGSNMMQPGSRKRRRPKMR